MLVHERDAIVLDISWHPSGNYLASVGSDGVLDISDVSSLENIKSIYTNKRSRSVRRVEFSPNGKFLVAAGFDNKAVIYSFNPDSEDVCKVQERLEGQDFEIKSARWSADGESIATCSRDKSVWIWSSEDGESLAIHRGHTADVKDVAFSPDQALVASVSFDGTLKTWIPDDESGEIQTFSEHSGTVWSLGFSPDGDIATIGEDGKAILYIKEDENYVFSKSIELQNNLQPLYSIVYSNGKWIIAGSERIIFFVDDEFNQIIDKLPTQHIGDINSCKPCPTNPNLLATCSDDGTVRFYTI